MSSGHWLLCMSLWICQCCSGSPVLRASDNPSHQPVQEPAAEITVDATKILGDVPPLVFGNNIIATDGRSLWGGKPQPQFGQTGDGVWDPKARRLVAETVTVAKEIGLTMLRYPGGCCSHDFHWKRTVGPLGQRPDYSFGLDEFLAYCRAVGAKPLITASDYSSRPQDNADLVEYLNAPADDNHPWAKKRAAWGHREPYQATYFGNGQ